MSREFTAADLRELSATLDRLLATAKREHAETRDEALSRKTQTERDAGLAVAEFCACMARQFKRWSTEFERIALELEEP